MILFKNYYVVILLLLFTSHCFSQDSNDYYTTYDSIVNKVNLPVYNGILYQDLDYHAKDSSHPYFNENKYAEGSVYHINQWYNDLEIKYDLLTQVLVLSPPSSIKNIGIELNQENIKSFYIGSIKFVNLSNKFDSAKEKGYYRQDKISNQIDLFTHISKTSKEFIASRNVELKFYTSYNFILKKGGQYYTLNDKDDLLTALPHKKEQIDKLYKNRSKASHKNDLEFNLFLLKSLNL